jgi:hypothetical protein
MTKPYIYVATSWRNEYQQTAVAELRKHGYHVYDFKNPHEGNTGFRWSDIDASWAFWTSEEFRTALSHPIAVHGFQLDFMAMLQSDICLLVLPCGKSAHLEAGYFIGANKKLIILLPENTDPELMYNMTPYICLSLDEVIKLLPPN